MAKLHQSLTNPSIELLADFMTGILRTEDALWNVMDEKVSGFSSDQPQFEHKNTHTAVSCCVF